MKATRIFEQVGYSVEMLGKPRIYAAISSFKKEAASPEGLHPSRHSQERPEARQERKIKELEKQMDKLELELELLIELRKRK